MTAVDRAPSLAWPLTGRRDVLEHARALLGDAEVLGVVIRGDMGTGKSRLATELARSLEADGRTVLRVMANATLRDMPFGALLHLIPTSAAVDTETLADALAAGVATGGAERAVLVVDDLPELDAASAVAVARVLAREHAVVVATARTGSAIPEAVMAYWRAGRVVAIELGPLAPASCATLLHRVLGGAVDARAVAALATLSQGNPLFLRELVLGTLAAGAFVETDAGWTLTGPLEPSSMLRDVVLARMEPEGARVDRAALESLALTDAVGLVDLEAEFGATTIEALEHDAWIRVEPSQRRLLVRLAHPLYGEILRDAQSRLRRRSVALAHVARVEARGARRRDDPLRLAQWRLDAEGQALAAELLAGARNARNEQDHARVEQLARAALSGASNETERVAAGQLLGDALHALGRFAESEVVLRAADDRARDPDRRLEIAAQRAANLFWGMGDLEGARRVATTAAEEQSGTNRAELRAHLATMELYAGDPRLAAELGDADDGGSPFVRAAFDAASAVALAMHGRTDAALEASRRGAAAHAEVGDLLATAHPGVHVVNRVMILTHAGRFDEAESIARAGWDYSVRERQIVGQVWFAAQLGDLALRRGQLAEARRWFEQQALCCSDGGQRVQLELAHVGVALAAGPQRDTEACDAALAMYDAAHVGWFGLWEASASRARVVRGRAPAAERRTRGAARRGRRRTRARPRRARSRGAPRPRPSRRSGRGHRSSRRARRGIGRRAGRRLRATRAGARDDGPRGARRGRRSPRAARLAARGRGDALERGGGRGGER
jgi:hypothetical protein